MRLETIQTFYQSDIWTETKRQRYKTTKRKKEKEKKKKEKKTKRRFKIVMPGQFCSLLIFPFQVMIGLI